MGGAGEEWGAAGLEASRGRRVCPQLGDAKGAAGERGLVEKTQSLTTPGSH
jgi:hypothetical protein